MEVEETPLPGIGVRHAFRTEEGVRVSLVSYRAGRHDVLVHDGPDPDAARRVLTLTAEEAEVVASLLGSARIARDLSALPTHVAGLVVEWIRLPEGVRWHGRPLGDTQARTRTGVSVVALVRHGEVTPSPGPQHGLLSGDTLVAVGTPDGVQALAALLTG